MKGEQSTHTNLWLFQFQAEIQPRRNRSVGRKRRSFFPTDHLSINRNHRMNTTITPTNYSQRGRERFEQAAHLDICAVAEWLGIELTPDGRRSCRGRCPACGGRLVLTANPGRNKGYCNGSCNRSLSTIDLTVMALNCTPRAAVDWLLSDRQPTGRP